MTQRPAREPRASSDKPPIRRRRTHSRWASELVAASYNIHGGIGTDDRFDPYRIATVIRELKADIVGLQELDGRSGVDQLHYLRDRLDGMEAVPGPTLQGHGGDYGNGLLTRLPVRSVRHVDLSVAQREPRGALDVFLELGAGKPLRVVVTHLGLRRWERARQIDKLLDALADAAEPLLLLGDINDWWPWSRSLRRLRRVFGGQRWVASFPSDLPFVALDQVLVRPAAALRQLERFSTPLSRLASDHLPLRARLDLEPLAEPGDFRHA